MKEPTKYDIGSAVIALMSLQEAIYKGWEVTPEVSKAINCLIEMLRFYYQFAPNDKKEGHIPSLAVLSQRVDIIGE